MFVLAFLPRSKRLLISWLQSPSAVILEPKKTKSVTVSIVSPSMCHEVMDFRQGCVLSPCLFKLYAEYIMPNAGLDEAPAGIKTAGRNINNLRYADDTTLIAESKEELKSLLMKVKEESEKAGLKLKVQKTKIMSSSPITSWQIVGETMEIVRDFFLRVGASKITADGDCSHEIKKHLLLGRNAVTNLYSILESRDFIKKGPCSESYGFSSSHVWM